MILGDCIYKSLLSPLALGILTNHFVAAPETQYTLWTLNWVCVCPVFISHDFNIHTCIYTCIYMYMHTHRRNNCLHRISGVFQHWTLWQPGLQFHQKVQHILWTLCLVNVCPLVELGWNINQFCPVRLHPAGNHKRSQPPACLKNINTHWWTCLHVNRSVELVSCWRSVDMSLETKTC
jgi:hypothetical protein